MYLESDRIRLRAPEPEDLEYYYRWENDTSLWLAGSAHLPYSRYELKQFIASEAAKDFYAAKQLRFTVVRKSDKAVTGITDLFDFSPFHRRAEVGVLIDVGYQKQGYATEAMQLLCDYGLHFLKLHQLYAYVPATSEASRRMLERCGFEARGLLTDWLQTPQGWENVYVMSRVCL